ncbi:MAG: 2-amino-4-hydroxy-6-hydroxymethyldihydropteridine diphosphokinase [Xanthomonadales bacterium]|nr:2-amino-4-hydroxy-6-hydroxymethyldihydropteridine diphosphokinase [Xanthomonadales bacterium]
MSAWVGLGGNREDSDRLIDEALARIAASPELRLLRRSALYRTPPWGVTDQPDFVNAVAELEAGLPAPELLQLLLRIETDLGRRRDGERWGPRCIDLDLLAYDDLECRTDALELPHPRMHLRAFVLVPLLELAPGFVIPGRGPAVDCLGRIDAGEVAAVKPLTGAGAGPEES